MNSETPDVDGARSFYRTELARAQAEVTELRQLLRADGPCLRCRYALGAHVLVDPFAPALTVVGVYFTAGRVQYRLSDGRPHDEGALQLAPPLPPKVVP